MDTTRLISTVAIWGATAVMFVSGFSRMSWSGLGGLFWVIGVCVLFASAVFATQAVWASRDQVASQVPERGEAQPDRSK